MSPSRIPLKLAGLAGLFLQILSAPQHEHAIFLQAINLPGGLDDPRHPFDVERFLEGFTEEARLLSATDDPVLCELAARAEAAWAAFLAQEDDETP
jgi:hypothetical protein